MQRDSIHWSVRNALENSEWTITADPFSLKSGGVWLHADLSAEKTLVAEKEGIEIVVEIKSFSRNSLTHDFHEAMGQYIDYLGALMDEGLNMKLFLAISEQAWIRLNKFPFYTKRIKQNQVNLFVVDIVEEKIIEWIEWKNTKT